MTLAIAANVICTGVAFGGEPSQQTNSRTELRWVESQRIEGLTEQEGLQSSCDPDSIVYPHQKPALVLTSAEVSESRLTRHDFSGPGVNYMVTLVLTKVARSKLAAACECKSTRWLTVVVDGHCWGLGHYETDAA